MTLGIGQGCCCINGCTSNVLTGYYSQANVTLSGYSPSTTFVDSFGNSHSYYLTALSGSLWQLVAPYVSAAVGNANKCDASTGIGLGCYAVGYDTNNYGGVIASANANWADTITPFGGGSPYTNNYYAWHNASVSVQQKTTDILRIAVRVWELTQAATGTQPVPAFGFRCGAYGCTDVPMDSGGLPTGFWTSTYSIAMYSDATFNPADNATWGGEPSSLEFGCGTASVTFS